MLTRPIARLRQYASDIAQGKKVLKPSYAAGEVKELADSLEQMRTTLDGKSYIENYVQNLTHEIKGPLTGIKTSAELLHTAPTEEDRQKFLGNIEAEASRLQDITERLLQLSAIERSNELIETQNFDLEKMIHSVMNSMEPVCSHRGLSLRFKTGNPLRASGDRFLLTQAVTNLVQNAADFANAGTAIELNVSNDGNTMQITVENEGPQIPEYALPRLFERFYSLPKPSGRRSSGLGLAFVSEVARLHGGSIGLVNISNGVKATLQVRLLT